MDNGELHRCPPKDESRRHVIAPRWLVAMVQEHLARTRPAPCACHGQRYVFTGHRAAPDAVRVPSPRLTDVARRAGVSVGTVSGVLNNRDSAAIMTRERVEAAMLDLGYVRGTATGVLAPHWRRNGFATWLFHPSATGWYPRKAPLTPRPVPLLADPWPGVPLRGRNAAGRAEACWVPIAAGLTPHGLRHTYKTMMVELGTPANLMDAQMGHADGSVQALYAHITQGMSDRLVDGLTERWLGALEVRRQFSPGSPVAVLDRLLRAES